MELYKAAEAGKCLSNEEIRAAVLQAVEGKDLKHVLILPPDFTRYHSNAGFITSVYYHELTARGIEVDIMPALGTHLPVTEAQWNEMYDNIPYEKMLVHNWRTGVVSLGEVPAEFVSEISVGKWNEAVPFEINSLVMDEKYDLIISIGQVVPHEVIGMANHSKNLFVGVGGSGLINKSHMISGVCGIENTLGKENTAVRRLFDYGMEHFLNKRPILFVLTVTTAPEGVITQHGLYIGEGRQCFTEAVKLAQEINVNYVDKSFKKCVVFMNPTEFVSTWIGNKSIYRTRMAMADEGELIVLAPGVDVFGEDPEIDRLIRKYGYKGTEHTMEEFYKPENQDLRDNMGVAAHLMQGSTDGRFTVTYAVKKISLEEVESVGFIAADYDEMIKKYDPAKLQYGYNTVDGEEIFYIPNPALGLWISRERF